MSVKWTNTKLFVIADTIYFFLNYTLCNADEFQNLHCKTKFFNNSFLPSGIYVWNNLDADTKNTEICSVSKKLICPSINIPIKKFLEFGTHPNQIVHCRLCLECSDSNDHVFKRYVSDSSSNNYLFKNTSYFLFTCLLYHTICQCFNTITVLILKQCYLVEMTILWI